MNHKNKGILIILILVLASIIILHVHRAKARTSILIENTGWNVACLGPNFQNPEIKQDLQGHYDIVHTPAEGGRCYFRFTKGHIVFQTAQRTQKKSAHDEWLPLSSHQSYEETCIGSGLTAYFIDDTHDKLIEALKMRPSVSSNYYWVMFIDNKESLKKSLEQSDEE